jgi:hypothetical protein
MTSDEHERLTSVVRAADSLRSEIAWLESLKASTSLGHTELTVNDWSNSNNSMRVDKNRQELLGRMKTAVIGVVQKELEILQRRYSDLST